MSKNYPTHSQNDHSSKYSQPKTPPIYPHLAQKYSNNQYNQTHKATTPNRTSHQYEPRTTNNPEQSYNQKTLTPNRFPYSTDKTPIEPKSNYTNSNYITNINNINQNYSSLRNVDKNYNKANTQTSKTKPYSHSNQLTENLASVSRDRLLTQNNTL